MSPQPRSQGRTVDWAAVAERLARARSGTENALAPPPERARAIMDERARTLAEPPDEPPPAADVIEVLTFGLGGERYAVETKHVREVVRLAHCTPMPGTPSYLLGVINLRGEILAVVDLRELLGLARETPTDRSWVVVLGADRAEFGVVVDEVGELVPLRRGEVLEPAEAGVGSDLFLGVTGSALGVLDGTALLRDPRLFVEQAESASA